MDRIDLAWIGTDGLCEYDTVSLGSIKFREFRE